MQAAASIRISEHGRFRGTVFEPSAIRSGGTICDYGTMTL
jgi:hypothetical protein